MSEFIHKAKIAALEQSNAELIDEILSLKIELDKLNDEIEHLRLENPDDIKYLREKVTEYEQREADLKEQILSISKIAENNNKNDGVVKQLLSALQVVDSAIVETAIEKYYKKNGLPKIIIAFLLGLLVPLVVWHIAKYLENDEFYNTTIKRVIGNIFNY